MSSKEARVSTELLTHVNWTKNVALLLIASFYISFDPLWAGAQTQNLSEQKVTAMLLGKFVKGAGVERIRETTFR